MNCARNRRRDKQLGKARSPRLLTKSREDSNLVIARSEVTWQSQAQHNARSPQLLSQFRDDGKKIIKTSNLENYKCLLWVES